MDKLDPWNYAYFLLQLQLHANLFLFGRQQSECAQCLFQRVPQILDYTLATNYPLHQLSML